MLVNMVQATEMAPEQWLIVCVREVMEVRLWIAADLARLPLDKAALQCRLECPVRPSGQRVPSLPIGLPGHPLSAILRTVNSRQA